MIKEVIFDNFRNLSGKYQLDEGINVIVGKNSSGKTNFLDGLKLAFYTLVGDYFPVSLGDFKDSDDSHPIIIDVVLLEDSIPSLISINSKKESEWGFKVIVKRTQSGRYLKQVRLLNGSTIDIETTREDKKLPKIHSIPLQRIEDILIPGLTLGISKFIESDVQYKNIIRDSKIDIKKQISKKESEFKKMCLMFNQNLSIELSDPKISNERLFVVDGDKEHNARIGSGYKSIANIFINSINDDFNIILIDEIENHLHPSLIRSLIRELRKIENIMVITTSHSPVVINELFLKEIIHISGLKLSDIHDDQDGNIKRKLNKFLHPGRNELILADNIILVEGYTEELLIRNYLVQNNKNWTVVNVAGVMFEPYVILAAFLNKNIVVISDNDFALSLEKKNSDRFVKLEELCNKHNIKLLEVYNTLESDLYKNKYLTKEFDSLLKKHINFPDVSIAKEKKKTEIAEMLIEKNVDLSDWHIIKGINDEFKSN
ncbi:AAA family ATPase [Hujiaoplasma nucleasis]|uniref:AAA family ATPase n=1 Tax=Hujiaoplasma nucleasis TaxID=2725268 RepID=A0A7L6N7T2_9MOLU|nr:AAA family ATPase [Hujiaoplasma nucleasis]QLY40604.1 AAA family ATPase [Hujiaoplasma nucleasis]